MKTSIRSFTFGTALLLLGGAMAQTPYQLYVIGQLEGCTSGTAVTVQTMPGTEPAQTVSVPVDGNCGFNATLALSSATGGVFAWATCGNGTVTADSSSYAFNNPIDSNVVFLGLSCGGANTGAVQACITVAQTAPFTAQFTGCTTGGTTPYANGWLLPDGSISLDASPTYLFNGPGAFGVCLLVSDATGATSATCDTVYVGADGSINPASTSGCQAGFWVIQAYTDSSNGGGVMAPVPNEVWVWNLSTGSNGLDTYAWDFGDGNSSAEAYPSHTYDGDGPYVLCLTITSGSCTSTYCDSISIDANGMLNGMVIDGHAAAPGHRSGGFTLNVIQSMPTGIAEPPAITELRLWPNPAQDELNISFTNYRVGPVPVTVIDRTGRTVIAGSHNLTMGSNTLRLNTESLAPGLYLLRIGDDARSVTHRFMKVR